MRRPLRPCARQGCSALVERGFCPAHTIVRDNPLRQLDAKKTIEEKRFYSSRAWTEASRRHRRAEPLCRRCRARGVVSPAMLVHHSPPLVDLWRLGLNPLDDAFLESLCVGCHMGELRAKRRR